MKGRPVSSIQLSFLDPADGVPAIQPARVERPQTAPRTAQANAAAKGGRLSPQAAILAVLDDPGGYYDALKNDGGLDGSQAGVVIALLKKAAKTIQERKGSE